MCCLREHSNIFQKEFILCKSGYCMVFGVYSCTTVEPLVVTTAPHSGTTVATFHTFPSQITIFGTLCTCKQPPLVSIATTFRAKSWKFSFVFNPVHDHSTKAQLMTGVCHQLGPVGQSVHRTVHWINHHSLD